MRHKFITLITLMIPITWIGCSSEDEFKENLELKTNLQGTWKRDLEASIWSQVTFNDHTLSWYDSTVHDGEIQSSRGQCPVKYTFNDGIEYYNPANVNLYSFSGTTENNLLWTILNEGENSTIVDYSIVNGVVSPGQSWQTSTPILGYISSSYVRFSNDRKTAEFCNGNSVFGITCISYYREN
jgi:hypothetical protein